MNRPPSLIVALVHAAAVAGVLVLVHALSTG